MLWVLGCAALGFAGFAIYVRLAGDGGNWHVDPETVDRTGRPNQYLVRDGMGADASPHVFATDPATLAAAFDRVAMGTGDVTRLAGDPAGLRMTYVARTKLMAYPDYVSVRAVERDGGAALLVYSRSRFGRSDLGVNKARIRSWMKRLAADLNT